MNFKNIVQLHGFSPTLPASSDALESFEIAQTYSGSAAQPYLFTDDTGETLYVSVSHIPEEWRDDAYQRALEAYR